MFQILCEIMVYYSIIFLMMFVDALNRNRPIKGREVFHARGMVDPTIPQTKMTKLRMHFSYSNFSEINHINCILHKIILSFNTY